MLCKEGLLEDLRSCKVTDCFAAVQRYQFPIVDAIMTYIDDGKDSKL